MQTQPPSHLPILRRAAIGALVFIILLLVGLRTAHAAQLVPSIGISHTSDGTDNHPIYALALRGGLLPRIQSEFQVGYRTEEMDFAGNSFELRTVPVSLSLWASPTPMLYAGGGVGAYFQAVEYANNLYPASDKTQWGVHLGGGLRMPLSPMVGLDLNGRYVFLQEQATSLGSGSFDPSFWTVSAGLAIGF